MTNPITIPEKLRDQAGYGANLSYHDGTQGWKSDPEALRAVADEIEKLRIQVDNYDSAIASRDLEIERLQQEVRSQHAAYQRMFDKAAALERRLNGSPDEPPERP